MDPVAKTKIRITLDQLRSLARSALVASGADADAASSLAEAFVAAEAEGLPNHGVARLPNFCEHLRVGKIDGQAKPVVSRPMDGVVLVDAANGLAHTAIDAGLPALVDAARRSGIATLIVRHAYSAHVIGYHTERIAAHGLVALGFANAPASIAPVGGRRPVVGTNPISFAVPRAGADPIVVDQAASVVAKSEIVDRARHGEKIPVGWALDKDGQPTTSSKSALEGTMVPFGGYKGMNMALLAEVLATAVAGGTPAAKALPFADMTATPMELGQCFIAIDAQAISGGTSSGAIEALAQSFAGQDARLPGARRGENRRKAEAEGVDIATETHERLVSYAHPEPKRAS